MKNHNLNKINHPMDTQTTLTVIQCVGLSDFPAKVLVHQYRVLVCHSTRSKTSHLTRHRWSWCSKRQTSRACCCSPCTPCCKECRCTHYLEKKRSQEIKYAFCLFCGSAWSQFQSFRNNFNITKFSLKTMGIHSSCINKCLRTWGQKNLPMSW